MHRLEAERPQHFEPGDRHVGDRIAEARLFPVDHSNEPTAVPQHVTRPIVAVQQRHAISRMRRPRSLQRIANVGGAQRCIRICAVALMHEARLRMPAATQGRCRRTACGGYGRAAPPVARSSPARWPLRSRARRRGTRSPGTERRTDSADSSTSRRRGRRQTGRGQQLQQPRLVGDRERILLQRAVWLPQYGAPSLVADRKLQHRHPARNSALQRPCAQQRRARFEHPDDALQARGVTHGSQGARWPATASRAAGGPPDTVASSRVLRFVSNHGRGTTHRERPRSSRCGAYVHPK